MNTIPSQIAFKDRSTGLTVFGILTVLMGVFWVLMVALMIVGQTISAQRADMPPPSRQMLIPVMIMYGSLAIVLVWLGIGSIKARRWARAILLILSWSCLIVGLVSLGFMTMMAPQFLEGMKSARPAGQPELSSSAQTAVLVIMGLILSFLFIVLPLVWVLFYGSKHVKATCESRDPIVRWTDRCPLPVLAISLWLAFGALTTSPIAYHGVFPFFGTFLIGPLGTVFYIIMGLVWAYSAYAIYKLDQRGWWLIFVSLCLFSISTAITYSRHGVMELYRLMGYPEDQIAQIQKFNFFKGNAVVWSSLISTVPVLGYLFYVRKFFKPGNSEKLA